MRKHLNPGIVGRRRQGGFTIVEVAIVLVILGILAIMTLPYFMRASVRASRASCFANQRNLMVSAALYAADHSFAEGNLTSAVLHEAGYVTDGICDCPSSPEIGYDDYGVTLHDGRVVWSTCWVMGVQHLLGDEEFPDDH